MPDVKPRRLRGALLTLVALALLALLVSWLITRPAHRGPRKLSVTVTGGPPPVGEARPWGEDQGSRWPSALVAIPDGGRP